MLWPRSATKTGSDERATEASRRQKLRPDIQGLRALAVLLVIADHAIGHPSGGYIGVDVFFVVSGFLITGLLLREQEKTGGISVTQFYKRRIKRIAPAAFLVIAAVVALAPLVFSPTRRNSTAIDALWALLSLGNWHMISIGTDYQHATDAVSPLQHYWSLAVEEQFYLVWPVLLILALALGRRIARPRVAAAGALTVVTVASLAFGAWQSVNEPTAAYFSTFSRGWELGLGGLLAIAAPRKDVIPALVRAVLGWGGLGLIAYAAVQLSSQSVFPVPGAVLPVLGTLAVILSGTGGPSTHPRPLTSRPMQWVGTRSYSLYLWHFPVIVFCEVLAPQHGTRFVGLVLVLSLSLAVLSYRFVEEPLRRRSWRRFRQAVAPPRPSRFDVLAYALVAATVLATVSIATLTRTPEHVDAVPEGDLTADIVPSTPEAVREAAVAEALSAPRWPALTPSPAGLTGQARVPEWLVDGCLGDEYHALPDPVANARRCVYGPASAPHTAVLLGDSTAISWMPGLRAALGKGWRIEVWTDVQCPAVQVEVRRGDGSTSPHCDDVRQGAAALIARQRPDLTILTSSTEELGRLTDGAAPVPATAEWERGTVQTLRHLAPFTKKLVVLDAPPDMHSAQDCIAPVTGPADCISQIDSQYLRVSRAQRAAVLALQLSDVSYPDTLPWFCQDGRCPSFVGTSPTLADGRHLTAAASAALAPVLRSVLLHAPIVPGAP